MKLRHYLQFSDFSRAEYDHLLERARCQETRRRRHERYLAPIGESRADGDHRLRIEIVDAPDVIEMLESPAKALRRKRRASIRVAAEHVASGGAAGRMSALCAPPLASQKSSTKSWKGSRRRTRFLSPGLYATLLTAT